ncbi:MAG: SRPBCC domain-containing protein [Nitrosomonas sp.]|nr:MAG: SRPBCC domain-containing protein [Nitrosomonas sp.]UJP07998.1 MAG: SRPBCC domain-containing protein [Nitrosomonas sp.]
MNTPIIKKDIVNKIITVERVFVAPKNRVWKAWTDITWLDKWWAPKPWIAITKSFDFSEGGHWHYCMSGPEGEKIWVWMEFESIEPENSFTAQDIFCDDKGKLNEEMPKMHWKYEFRDNGEATTVHVTITFNTIDDMEKIIAMCFEAGFSLALSNLDEVLGVQTGGSHGLTSALGDKGEHVLSQTIIPQLRITSAAASLPFYVDGLGFVVDWKHQFEPGFPLFVQLTRRDQTIFLTEHAGDCQVGGAIYFVVPDVEDCYQEFTNRGITTIESPHDTPWKSREMVVTDPDGNRLRFATYVAA